MHEATGRGLRRLLFRRGTNRPRDPRGAWTLQPHDGAPLTIHDAGTEIAAVAVVQVDASRSVSRLTSARCDLLNDLIRPQQQRRRDRQAERFRGPEVDS